MPKLWKDTVEEHRRDVRAAILDAAWRLAHERGIRGVTMGLVAQHAGISRATLYKYFSGVEEILVASHAEHVQEHLATLREAHSSAGTPREGLERLIDHYAEICFHRGRAGAPDTSALVHAGEQHQRNTTELERLFIDAVLAAQAAGEVRADIAAKLLATYILHAAEGAGSVGSRGEAAGLATLAKECLGSASGSTGPTTRH
ncbi:TetR/AcrR family transcriptional regulator [Nocardioides jensenii]|uniref:TetR/AcrR family transcriptional regulator n=1 Tax=Nocardioides jensenii TaxID=1843 RepID=UPI00082E1BA2|nr:TetR/AcrR family transcriptional regulator [Nocardioides jensenii]